MKPSVYAQSGVNIDAGAELSSIAMKQAQRTWNANPAFASVEVLGDETHFRATRILTLNRNNPLIDDDAHLSPSCDGIGTKVLLDVSAGTLSVTAKNLIAMTGDDVTAEGGLPIGFSNVLNINSSAFPDAVEQLHRGLAHVCVQEGIIVVNGETAELGSLIGGNRKGFVFEWSGTMEGLYRKDKLITGAGVEAGDGVYALQEPGPRSNGISSIRRGLKIRYGPNWSRLKEAREHVKLGAQPSTVYSRLFSKLNGWYNQDDFVPIKHIAHLSGGGIVDKFGTDLLKPLGLSASLTDLFEIPEILRLSAKWNDMTEHEFFRTYSAGQGALVTISQHHGAAFLKQAEALGFVAKQVGYIMPGNDLRLEILSKLSGEIINYDL